ncbi:hypothetical protein [Corynebacterium liangguodongii]|uniref:Uncharacterized protein n=1 Tax=Corynebacterium liangguodongii TaxID=2079535 RepID=A0A2S0WEF4_9CORY|nr:hypothetical protein [Corynebacterium liangguodongii]AWB84163.1 hypothetical protein C3E79_06470 [Corynebacterium liangguodongii]PWC00174.1 hypothetical protein DF219_03110 [Corynebacterium liangguodongii]
MTIQIERNNAPQAAYREHLAEVLPAEVWDIPAAPRCPRRPSGVRTRGVPHRNYGREKRFEQASGVSATPAFETRHENRAGILMGVILGLALIVGSAAGGAFGTDASTQGGGGVAEVSIASVR